MTQAEIYSFIEQFLNHGGFLRMRASASGQCFVWTRAPFMDWQDFQAEKQASIYVQDFFGSPQAQNLYLYTLPVGIFEKAVKIFLDQSNSNPQKIDLELTRQHFEPPRSEDFLKSFQIIQGKIQRGEIDKAVPIVQARCQGLPTLIQRAQLILKTLICHQELYAYGYWQQGSQKLEPQKQEGLIGASPEILFHLKDGRLTTMAFAGTASLDSAGVDGRDLLADPKERHEHQLVIKDLQERLENFGPVQVSATEAVQFPGLWHLRTFINCEVGRIDATELIAKMHPTPALGVSPRNHGFRWMFDLPDQSDRAWFGAPLTFQLSPSESVSVVAIRNIHWHDGKTFIASGCGLVSDSRFEKEWAELSLKRESVFKLLGL